MVEHKRRIKLLLRGIDEGALPSAVRRNRQRASGFKAERDEARAVLREVEWCVQRVDPVANEVIARCPWCSQREQEGHAPGCQLAAVLKEGEA